MTLAAADKLVFSKARAFWRTLAGPRSPAGKWRSWRDAAEFIDSLGITVYEGYGLTETSLISTANCPASAATDPSAARSPACTSNSILTI